MSSDPILLMGGSGAIGSLTARTLRQSHPDLPLLIGGRDLLKCREIAAELGHAEGVVLDPTADDLGLGNCPVRAVALFYSDDRLAGLRFALERGVPYLGISSGVYEIAPEIAAFMLRPTAAAIVLGYEWLVGATTIPTLEFAKAFGRVEDIVLGALVDEKDGGGPAVAEDFERLHRMMPSALTRRDGAYVWRSEEDAKTTFHAVDGTEMQASGFSSIDVAGLATSTGARNVQFDIATGVSSSRRRGEPLSTEIIIELGGMDHAGRALRTRHAVVHPQGAAPLTALGVSMILERLTGLGGGSPTAAGLYFPFQVLDHAVYLGRLKAAGVSLITLEAR
jgi:hypothetical protein